MENYVNYVLLVLSLLNLGLVMIVINRLGGLRKLLVTPVVKKFNPADFKRKPVDIPKEMDKKDFRQNRNNQQSLSPNRPKNNPQQQNRPAMRRPAAKAPDVFSNDVQVGASSSSSSVPPRNPQAGSIPPRPVAPEQSLEGRRPLPPRFAAQESIPAFGSAPADLAPLAPAPVTPVMEDSDEGVELDRSKMTHGRRNMVKKSMIDDDDNNAAEEKSVS